MARPKLLHGEIKRFNIVLEADQILNLRRAALNRDGAFELSPLLRSWIEAYIDGRLEIRN